MRVAAKNVGAPTAVIVKIVLSGLMGMEARYDAVPTNPVVDMSTPQVEKPATRALPFDEFKAMGEYAKEKMAPRTTKQRL